jgi:hypothetical protein
LVPLLLANLIWSIHRLVVNPGADRVQALLVVITLVLMAVLVRTNALKAQDRVIRLEERLRYERVLPAALAARAVQLDPGQIIALRFASDGELADRVSDVLDGRAIRPGEIKRSIRVWRPDTFRI